MKAGACVSGSELSSGDLKECQETGSEKPLEDIRHFSLRVRASLLIADTTFSFTQSVCTGGALFTSSLSPVLSTGQLLNNCSRRVGRNKRILAHKGLAARMNW